MAKWTRFMDMHSGGNQKLDWPHIYIEASEAEAKIVFYNRFGRNPERVTCACCGDDYSIGEHNDLAQASAYDRGCAWSTEAKCYVESPREHGKAYKTEAQWLSEGNDLIIYEADIKPHERVGAVPAQDYVWVD